MRSLAIGMCCLTIGAAAFAQTAPPGTAPPGTTVVQADPIRCWWRTSAGAVRVGESFSVVLTCAVIENESTKVVPDEHELDPVAIQMPPFEVVSGTHPADQRTRDRRFFQYQYTLRLLSDSMFTKDATLEGVPVPYRIQTRVDGGPWSEGRQYTYFLPETSVRILSLVPQDASDIRDASNETFTDLDARVFRADVLLVVATVLFAFGGLMVVLALVRLARKGRVGTREMAGMLSGRAILGSVASELANVRREREAQGWTADLARRALAACRIAGTYALGFPVAQLPAAGNGLPSEGQLVLRGGWPRRAQVKVSGSVTPATVTRELTRLSAAIPMNGSAATAARVQRLEALHIALSNFTAARYGRVESLNDDRLYESLAAGTRLVTQLKAEHTWLAMKSSVLGSSPAPAGQQVWLR